MQDHAYLQKYTYDQHMQPYELSRFLVDLVNDPSVNPHVRVLGTKDRWCTLGTVSAVHTEPTSHTVTTLAFFDRLRPVEGGPVVRKTGEIVKCLDEYHERFLVADELRRCLIVEEAETYALFGQEEREEFIFHVFKALCLGGKLCQYEDELEPYLNATKLIYKDLISVAKDPQTNKLRVSSLVYKVTGLDSSVSPLFPSEHPQNFCYVSIDPMKRTVSLLYHASDTYY
ncbi:hypothetical protein HKX48_007499 [Thoreauomyces humboldtii]|nr:hypothetical protein HKX48_007499 [Thoreauomyces humboldtii]